MFVANEDLSVFCTRGDYCEFPVKHDFKAGDVIRFKATRKKDCNTVVIQRDFVVEADTDSFMITLSGDDTKIGEVISKPVDYWYEIELNPDTQPETIIAYDENGAKIFRLYPEGKDVDGEDIEVVGHKTLQELVDYALLEAKETGMFDGEKGDPGYTPQRGIDYWTEEDEAKLTEALDVANEAKETAEQTEANLIDKLCPNINESGAIVACEPLSGYPLTVQAENATKVYRCGKNLLSHWTGNRVATGMTFKGNGDGSITITGTPTKQWTASCFISIPPEIMKGGKTYSCTPTGNPIYKIYFRWWDADGKVQNTNQTGVVLNRITWDDSWTSPEIQIYCPNIQEYNETVWLQLELGETATAFEPYVREEIAQGEAIPSLDGVNTIWADSGDVTVTGKADPVAIMENLTNAILSLGGNV